MNKTCFLVILFSAVLTSAVTANDEEMIKIGKDAFAFHNDQFPDEWVKLSRPVVIDSEIFVEMIGLNNIGKINQLKLSILRSYGIKNAVALFKDGFRLIVYDPDWAKTVGPEFYLVLGHEAGHHFCGHTLSAHSEKPWKIELQADRFAGASIKRFETYHEKKYFDDVMKAASKKYSIAGSRSHPPRAKRLEAIRAGYNEGSPCADLAPGIPGYSRERSMTDVPNSLASSDNRSEIQIQDRACSGEQVQQCRSKCAQNCWRLDRSLPAMDVCVPKCWNDCNIKYCGIKYQ